MLFEITLVPPLLILCLLLSLGANFFISWLIYTRYDGQFGWTFFIPSTITFSLPTLFGVALPLYFALTFPQNAPLKMFWVCFLLVLYSFAARRLVRAILSKRFPDPKKTKD